MGQHGSELADNRGKTSAMKLLFFTPTIKRSAIGRMAALVVRELIAQGHAVTVVRTESISLQDQETHDFGVSLVPWNELHDRTQEIQTADQFIYQVGDNYSYHEGCLHWMPKLPGIVCLHDFFLGSLFWAWSESRRDEADSILRYYYGDAAAESYFNAANPAEFIADTHEISPMTEWISSMALGVITHSEWGCRRVLSACAGPVCVVPLAYNRFTALAPAQTEGLELDQSLNLLTIGHVNANKRVESVIRAISSNPDLKRHITYTLVGFIEQEVELALSSLARRLGVKLVISGQVDDTELAQAISNSDVVSCLRWPTLEAASASAIEAMLYGKAVICTDAGFYAELPDDCIFKILPQNEIDDLSLCLTKLLHDRDLIMSYGENAQRWASKTFVASDYARSVEQMVARVLAASPVLEALGYFSDIGNTWSGADTYLLAEDDRRALGIFT